MSTITIEKGNTVYGGDSEDYNTYIVKEGGKLDIQRRLWKADGGVTVEPGGSFVKDGSFETYTHIKSKVVIGEEGNETVSTLSLTSSSYPWSISTLWNGSLTAYNTNIKLGDLGSVGATKLYDCVVNLDGIIAMGVNTANGSHTFTNTTVSVKGYAIRKDSTYFSAEGSILNKLTLDNSTITIDDGAAGSTSQKTVIKKLTMKNNSVITVESGANTILAGEISIDGTSSLSVGNLQIDEGAKLVIDGENTESVIRFSGTFSNTGANGLTVDMTNVKNSMYKVLDYTGDAASAPTDYGTIKFVNLSDGFRGVFTVENGDLCVTAISNDTEVAAPVEDKVVEVSATEKKSIKSHVVNVGSNETALHRVEAPSEDVTTGTKTEGNVTTTFINPAGNIYLNSQAEDITDKTEFRTSVEQESKEYNIFVNNYTSAEDEEQNGGYATTGGVMSITGSLNSAKDIVINNGEGAVMQGADEDTGFKASAVNMEITNDGHMVADVHADKNMTIHNNSINTLKGTVSGKTVVIDGTGKIENAVIDSYDKLTIEDTQTLVNSTLTAKTFVNDGVINMDSSSLIQWGKTWTDNTGTINVIVGDAPEERVYKVIDYTGASTTKKYTTTNYTVDNTDYSFTTVDSDLYVENLDGIDYSTIAVGYNWTDYDYGKDIEIGKTIYYYKINAFGTLSDVKKTLLTDGVTILFADAEEVPGTSTAIDALTVGNFELTIDGVAKR